MAQINIALLGKVGHGKSSTGNTILQRCAFAESPTATDSTILLNYQHSKFENYTTNVYDLPGIQSEEGDVKTEIKRMMQIAKKIHLFIFVFNYTCRFSAEEFNVYNELVQFFGNDFLTKHGMIVVTHGDNCAKEALDRKMSTDQVFSEWCENSGENFNSIRKLVDGRIQLIYNTGSFQNNKERIASSKKIHETAVKMFFGKPPYTKEDFDKIQTWCSIA